MLDNIEGIGEKRKTALLAKFGSVENIRNATVYELSDTEGMNQKAAESVAEYFAKDSLNESVKCTKKCLK